MRRKYSPPHHPQPGLFDGLDDFNERLDRGFEIIPPERMADIARSHAQKPEIDELPPLQASDRVFFMSFGSGSSGNCAYIGDRNSGFLVDAGIDAKKVTSTLQANGITMDRIQGIILTHDHHDHISQAYAILRANRHIRLYCTPRTFNGILRRHNVSRRIKDYHQPIYKEFTFKLGNFEITPFEVLHDGADISPRLRNLYLCHLSHDNNLPQIALHTIEEAISQRDDALILLQGLRLVALPRYAATPLYTL